MTSPGGVQESGRCGTEGRGYKQSGGRLMAGVDSLMASSNPNDYLIL